MMTVEEALAAILSRVRPLGSERVVLQEALGRVLAERVVSTRVIPPWPNSAMDGYAVRAVDTGAGLAELRVVGRVTAGRLPERSLGAGEAMRIFTGAPLPEGADSVVPQEDVTTQGERVRIRGRIERGACVRPAGEDVRVGDVVLEPGCSLGAAEIGLLATLGHAWVRVGRRPRVALLSTGDELADLGVEPGPGQIPNTNTYSLMGQVLEAGGEPVNLGIAPDRLEAIEERVRSGMLADAIVSSAGVSVGELDLVREVFTRAGAELHLWQVAMRPGKPITYGSLAGRPVFGLPGNPVSAMVTFELFVRPALRKMAGAGSLERARIRARALQDIANADARRAYLRVTLERDGGGWGARLTGGQGSAVLSSMVAADGLAVVPGETRVPSGEEVDVILLRALDARQSGAGR